MKWLRRRRRRFKPFDASELPDAGLPSVEDSVAEGLMLAEYASRMKLKNAIIVGAIARQLSYGNAQYADEAKATLDNLAEESDRHTDRLRQQLRSVVTMLGIAAHAHDYRLADTRNLEHRLASSLALAEALRARRDDDEYLTSLVERARDDAWSDIARAVEESLDRANIVVDAAYNRGREKRMRLLAATLTRAAAQRSP